MPELRDATERDWQIFKRLAKAEGWRVPQREQQLLQDELADAVQVLGDADVFCGMISAVAHARSGWIGNLLVPSQLRRQGFGKKLFEAAIEVLDDRGVDSMWLTASEQGQPLYTRYGFEVVGEIERWVLPPGGSSVHEVSDSAPAQESLVQADAQAWGESRDRLLEGLAPGARAFAEQDAVALLQTDAQMQILGPWYAPNLCPRGNRLLLQTVLAGRNPNLELVIDLFADTPLKPLLAACGFSAVGKTTLMVRGKHDRLERQSMVSLASLGSIG